LFANYSVTNTTGVTQTGLSKVQFSCFQQLIRMLHSQYKQLTFSQDPDNSDTSVSNANILVRINNHFYKGGTTGITT